MKFENLVIEFENGGFYLQDLGESSSKRYVFSSISQNNNYIEIIKNNANTLEELKKSLEKLRPNILGKYKVEVIKLIFDEAPDEEFSKLMTEMEKEFKIPLLNNPEWNEKNKDIINFYRLISDCRKLENQIEDDWDMEI